jgi:peptide/nickel transport system substrate-binding protein
MVKKILLSVLLILLLTSSLFTACTKSTTTTPAATTKPATTVPAPATTAPAATTPATTTPAKWWDKLGKPKYGGTLTFQTPSLDSVVFDLYLQRGWTGSYFMQWFEEPLYQDWALDPNIWPKDIDYAPPRYMKGCLVESWEINDPVTITFKVRKGIYWQNKPPVNGREFIASDIEYSFNRLMGRIDGFKVSPMLTDMAARIQSVNATDKYTLVFKLIPGYFAQLGTLGGHTFVVAPEAVKQFGDLGDWKNAIGTGPFMLTDFVKGSSLTYVKNPNYWGYDERYPQNRLPYVDEVKVLAIADPSTAISALRTGKIDMLAGLNWRQVDTLQKTDPKIYSYAGPYPGYNLSMRVDKAPFTDIKVRKALEMAIDRPTIAKTYFGGTVDGKPCGPTNPALKTWTTPFDEWPQALKDEYTYNPTKAKQLLAEAGYPAGFKTNIVASTSTDLDLLQIIKSEFLDIGVDMEIRTMEPGATGAYVVAMKHDQMYYVGQTGNIWPPNIISVFRHSKKSTANYSGNNDPAFDAMVDKVTLALTEDEATKFMRDMEAYLLKQHWDIYTMPLKTYTLWQPYLKGYSGEVLIHDQGRIWARLWVDKTAP